MTRATDELKAITATSELEAIMSEVEALRAKLEIWERAGRFITDAGAGLDDVLSEWLGQAEREIEDCRADAATAELRRRQSVASRGAE